MSSWLSETNTSNRFKQTYVQGFVDISGNLVVRNGRVNILVDSSFNGNIYTNASITANKNVYVLGDTSFNGIVTSLNDASFSKNIYVGGNVSVFGSDFRLRDVILQKTGTISGNTTLSLPFNQLYNITATNNINITLPKISTSRLEGGEITFYKTGSASSTATLYPDASDGIITYGTITSGNSFAMPGSKTSVKFVVAPSRWVEVGSSAIASLDGSFVNMVLSGNLSVLRDVSFGANLVVANDASFGGNVRMNRALRVANDTSIGGNLFVLRDASFGGNLVVLNDASFGKNVAISGNLRVLNDASFGGNVVVLKNASFGNSITVGDTVNVAGNIRLSDIYGNEKYRNLFYYDFESSLVNQITGKIDASVTGSSTRITNKLSTNGVLSTGGLKISPLTTTTLLTYFRVSSTFRYLGFNNQDQITLFLIKGTNGAISTIQFTPNATQFFLKTNNDNNETSITYTFSLNQTYQLDYQQYINYTDITNSAYIITITTTTSPTTTQFNGSTTINLDNLQISNIYCGYNGTLSSSQSNYTVDSFLVGTNVADNVYINSKLNVTRDAVFSGVITTNNVSTISINTTSDASIGRDISVTRNGVVGGNLTVSKTVYGTSDASFGGNLTVLRNQTIGGNLTVSRTVYGTSDASFGGNLTVLQNQTIGGNLTVSRTVYGTSDASFGGNLTVLQNQTIGGNLTVSKTVYGLVDASFGGSLTVLQNATISGNLTVSQNETVGGNLTVSRTVYGLVDASFGGNLTVLRNGAVSGNLTVSRTVYGTTDASFGGNLTVLQNGAISGNLTVARTVYGTTDASFGRNLTVLRNGVISGNLTVSQRIYGTTDASFGGNLTVLQNGAVSGNLTVSRTVYGTSDASFGGNVFGLNNATFNGNLVVLKNASITGGANVSGVITGLTDASFGGNVYVQQNIILNDLVINTESITRGNDKTLENVLNPTSVALNSIATSYDGSIVYYIDGASIYKSSNYGATFSLFSTLTGSVSRIVTNQYGNVAAVLGPSASISVFRNSSTRVPISLDSTANMSDVKMNSDGSIYFSGYQSGSDLGVYKVTTTGTSRSNVITTTTNANNVSLFKNAPLYYTPNNESVGFPMKRNPGNPDSTASRVINSVYLYNNSTGLEVNKHIGLDNEDISGTIRGNITSLGFKITNNTIYDGDGIGDSCAANTPDNTVKIVFFLSLERDTFTPPANKILKIVVNSDANKVATSLTPTAFTAEFSDPAFNAICCGDNGQNLYIATTSGLYYMYDPDPMNTNIANNTISLIPQTAGMNIQAIACSKDTNYIYFSTSDKKMYRYLATNNTLIQFDKSTNNVGIRQSTPQVELDIAGSVKIDKNLFVNSLTVTKNNIIHQNKFTLSNSTSTLNKFGLYPESIATSYDGRYVYYLDASSASTSPAIDSNNYSSVFKSADYGVTFTNVYNVPNQTGNTITKIATNNSGSDVVFQQKQVDNLSPFTYSIIYSTNYGTIYTTGYFVDGVNNYTGASLSYTNSGSIILGGYYGSTNSGVRKLNTISATSLSSVFTGSDQFNHTQLKMYGVKTLYYSEEMFSFRHNEANITSSTTPLEYVYYLPKTTSVSITAIDSIGQITPSTPSIKVSGNLTKYNFIQPSSIIKNSETSYANTTILPGSHSTGCSANTPDGSVKLAFLISKDSPTKILKVAYDGTNILDSCITIPSIIITGVCCGDNGQHLYIATTNGLYYMLDTSPMTSNIADNKLLRIPGTDYMSITAISCSKTSEYIYFSTADGTGTNRLYRLFNNILLDYTDGDPDMSINPYSGNVGIRNQNPRYELDVGGSMNISNTAFIGGNLIVNGSVTANAFNATSDRRLKTNIHSLSSQWENIKRLQPAEYTWRDTYNRDYGFIAQQVFDIYPHMRSRFHLPSIETSTLEEPMNIFGEPQYYSLDYSKMTTMLCKGLQEAMEHIERQQVEIAELKHTIYQRLGPDV